MTNENTQSQDPATSADEQEITEHQYRKLKRKLKDSIEVNRLGICKYQYIRSKPCALKENKLHSVESTHSDSHGEGTSEEEGTAAYSDVEVSSIASLKAANKASRKASPFQSKSTSAGTKRKRRNSASTTVISAPPKRNRNPNVKVTTRRIQPVPRDEDGHPVMPLQIGVLTVQDLGHVVWDRPGFHTERYIWPVGYTITRSYPSMIDANNNTTVRATILDDGNNQPLFRIECEDCPSEPIIANSATGAWTAMVKRANEVRGILRTNSASGPDYYGLGHATIASLVQELEGADKCQDYVWQQFEAMQDRAAKGVMKACAKKRGNLEKLGSVKYRMVQKAGSALPHTDALAIDNEAIHDELVDEDADMEPPSSLAAGDEDDTDELDENDDETVW
ncbi:unnamed protein product [Umbelopsis sp. WA50703]